jgi:myo-inositol-1(or 4)-monophosphatase
MNAGEAVHLRAVLEAIARRAGEHLLASFERLPDADVRHKGAVDLVTRLDVEAQALVLEGLAREFPGERVVAEEDEAAGSADQGVVWLVDPLDGTTNFVHGQPPFAVSIARARDGVLEAGVVYAPYLREMFFAACGHGAFLGARRLHVSGRAELDHALLATGFPYDIRSNPRNNLREFAHLAVRCRGVRRGGAASLDLAYVAAGRLDGYWEFRLKPWDLAAGVLLVQEAGGRVSDPAGGADWLRSGDVVATNGPLQEPLRAALGQAGAGAEPGSLPGGMVI